MNKDELAHQYDIFLISTSEKYLPQGAYILDAPLLCNNVCAVCFETGREFYVLMKKCDTNKVALKKAISESDGGDVVTISAIAPTQIHDSILVQLLLNSLANYELDFMRFNNLTGHLYCFHPKWIKKDKRNGQYVIIKVPCLELKVSQEMKLILQVHTFSSVLLRNKITFGKKKFEKYPQYIFSANNSLRRRLKDDDRDSFILRQTDGDKTTIPFLDIQNKEKFDICKMGVLVNIIKFFNSKFENTCHIDFSTIDDYISLDRTRAVAREDAQIIEKILSLNPIKIVDEICDEYSANFCKEIQSKLYEKYSISVTIGKRVSKDALNICVIHNAVYYEDAQDPHSIKRDGCAVQHITFEHFMGNADYALLAVIHELLIKNDIRNGKISLFDWTKLGLQENVLFGLRDVNEDGDRYFFMNIFPDGSFTFVEQKLNLFELSEYTECINIFEDNPTVCGIIKRNNGNINIISDTDWITIPKIDEISEQLSAGNTQLRNREKREELLSSILDIKLFSEGTSKYYFTGTIGEGMRTKVMTAANIRKITPYKDASLMFDDLLPLMNVTFVHNGQLTVVPFPFKYLREYIVQL